MDREVTRLLDSFGVCHSASAEMKCYSMYICFMHPFISQRNSWWWAWAVKTDWKPFAKTMLSYSNQNTWLLSVLTLFTFWCIRENVNTHMLMCICVALVTKWPCKSIERIVFLAVAMISREMGSMSHTFFITVQWMAKSELTWKWFCIFSCAPMTAFKPSLISTTSTA